jgi:carbon-monoxide dehydrogenase small subunit
MKHILKTRVNGRSYEVAVSARRTLAEFLREDLGLTGVKVGCGEGECGACTVLLDGQPVASCTILALEVQGREVTTIEGLADGRELHPLQKAFVKHGAIQCGYCTPGMILTSKALLDRNPHPSESEIREALAGNLCRCTGYQKIVEAVEEAAGELAANGEVSK